MIHIRLLLGRLRGGDSTRGDRLVDTRVRGVLQRRRNVTRGLVVRLRDLRQGLAAQLGAQLLGGDANRRRRGAEVETAPFAGPPLPRPRSPKPGKPGPPVGTPTSVRA